MHYIKYMKIDFKQYNSICIIFVFIFFAIDFVIFFMLPDDPACHICVTFILLT